MSRAVPFTYPYPRPSVTADVVAFTIRGDDLVVLLIKRKDDPFKGTWALPGGFVNENEALERAASRELYEETGVSGAKLEQLGAFGDPGRDPRGHTVTVAFVTFRAAFPSLSPGDDAVEAEWQPMRLLAPATDASTAKAKARAKAKKKPKAKSNTIALAFDHATIVSRAYRRLCKHLDDPIRDPAFDLVPPRFTLAELRRIYEIIIGRELTPQYIRQYFVDRKVVVPATPKHSGKPAARLYRWNRRA